MNARGASEARDQYMRKTLPIIACMKQTGQTRPGISDTTVLDAGLFVPIYGLQFRVANGFLLFHLEENGPDLL